MVVRKEEELAVAMNLKVFTPASFSGVVACAEWFEVARMLLRRWWPTALLHLDGVAVVAVATAEIIGGGRRGDGGGGCHGDGRRGEN
ncbi:hypothetical protein DEO72_LG3g1254 [Vigna unguiculata]|uniref:Uncharacterized protein n=1 Tax=Vigna unguiculata TaxID=3917 RepID=A0A4D6LDY6_VIGUN|nr:hypothetical protein DEO72_LG3g1254 [Vigna unguiculata]